MAGDWIKMRVDLADDPAVIGIATELELDEDLVVGKLHRVWSWANRQTENGDAPSVTRAWLDRYIGVAGFAHAMENVGWLAVSEHGLNFPHFDRHNGETAKSRALAAKRNQRYRAKRDATSVTEASPEKRREEKRKKKKPPTPFFPEDLINPLQPDLKLAWCDFCQHRRELKKPLTPTAAKAAVQQLHDWGVARAIVALRHTVAKGWQGIREPDAADAARYSTDDQLERAAREKQRAYREKQRAYREAAK